MVGSHSRLLRSALLAQILNTRVVKTSYAGSALYFIVAVALALLFYFVLVTETP